MDVPINVPVDNPDADTEWNDILRKHGIIPEKPPSPTPLIEEAIRDAQERAHENRLDEKDLQELHELEDEEDEEFLETYRKQRIQELSTISKSSLHGQVYHLQKLDYARDVTEASKSSFVVVHLQGINTESRLLSNLWRELARKFGDIKFCEIQGDMCIEGYPDKNCPTILVYHDGEVVKQMLTLRDLRGQQTAQHDLEQLLVDVGAVKSNDYRVLHRGQENGKDQANSQANSEDVDDDWD